jgi:hypothetical protein
MKHRFVGPLIFALKRGNRKNGKNCDFSRHRFQETRVHKPRNQIGPKPISGSAGGRCDVHTKMDALPSLEMALLPLY